MKSYKIIYKYVYCKIEDCGLQSIFNLLETYSNRCILNIFIQNTYYSYYRKFYSLITKIINILIYSRITK